METINYFEVLGAPTSSDSKLIVEYSIAALHLEPNQKTKFRQELQNPSSRLYSELTTVRIGETYPNDDGIGKTEQVESDRRNYLEYFRKLTGSKAEPIDHAYAGAWFKKYMKVMTGVNILDMDAFTLSLSREDPWLLQGLAACVLRIAINSEATESPNSAASVWKLALALYKEFFSLNQLETSYTYLYTNNNAEDLEECRRGWGSFIVNLLENMGNRISAYLADNNYRALNCCVEVLNASFEGKNEVEKNILTVKFHTAAKIEKIYDQILSDCSRKIQNCTKIANAEPFYINCPEIIKKTDANKKLPSAMVTAMKKESESIAAGSADIKKIEQWSKKLGLIKAYISQTKDVNQMMLTSNIMSFFSEVASQIRNKLNIEDEEHPLDEYEIIRLIDLLPDDFSVGKLPDHTDLTACKAKANQIIGILNNLLEADVKSESTKEALERFYRYQSRNKTFFAVKTVEDDEESKPLISFCDQVYSSMFIRCINAYQGDIDYNNILKPFQSIGFGRSNARTLALTVAGLFPEFKRIQMYTIPDLFGRLNATYPNDIIPVSIEEESKTEQNDVLQKTFKQEAKQPIQIPLPAKQEASQTPKTQQPAKKTFVDPSTLPAKPSPKTHQPAKQEAKKPNQSPQPAKRPVKPEVRKTPATTPAKPPSAAYASIRTNTTEPNKEIMKFLNQRALIDYLFIGVIGFFLPFSVAVYFISGVFSIYLLFTMVLIVVWKTISMMAVYFKRNKKGNEKCRCYIKSCSEYSDSNYVIQNYKTVRLCKEHSKEFEGIKSNVRR